MFTIKEILDATGGKLVRGRRIDSVCGVCIDSRSIKPKELFVAIKGERFDGHSFIEEAMRKQAGAILFAGPGRNYPNYNSLCQRSGVIAMVRVKDTVQALGALAHYHRKRFQIPVVAITGSSGKTTTKEMLSYLLRAKFNVLRNPGTQNNLIGVPLAIFALRKKHDLGVIELGASRTGEIDRLSWIIQPNIAIVTNIGRAHLKFFKTLKGVFNAKLEVIKNLAKGGKLIVNRDDRFLSRLNGINLQTITFGQHPVSDFYAGLVKLNQKRSSFLLNKRHRIALKTLGRHNVYNALAAIACARGLGMSFRQIKARLSSFVAPPMRMQLHNLKEIKLINDCYNANPESLSGALDFLKEVRVCGKKIAVCGDMLELGQRARRLHKDIGAKIAQQRIDSLITVGPLARNIALGAHLAGMSKQRIYSCRNCAEAARYLQSIAAAGDIVLVKGSRAMQMENVIKCFTSSSIH